MTLDVHFVTDADDPRLDDFRALKEKRLHADAGKFVAESEGVVRKLLASGLEIVSLLLTAPRLATLEGALRPDTPVYVVPQEVMDQIAGFPIHRGCLAIGRRPHTPLPAGARRVVVLEDLVDVDNLGALVRNAAAFDLDAVVLSPRCADPFYRKAIRVSMGTVFSLPIVRHEEWPRDLLALRDTHGLALLAATLDDGALPLPAFTPPDRWALLLGSEGPGLRADTKAACDTRLVIPMAREKADSLNVATAGAICLYELTKPR